MQLLKTIVSVTFLTMPISVTAQTQTGAECGDGLQDNGDGCVPIAAIPGLDALGLPTGVEVTNFAPAVLPLVAGVSSAAIAAFSQNGSEGSNGTNGTNGTN